MNWENPEAEVADVLHELFPEPEGVSLRFPVQRGRARRPRWLVAVVAATSATVAVVLGVGLVQAQLLTASGTGPGAGGAGASQSSGTPTTASTSRASPVPAWAAQCLPKGEPAPDYVGLTWPAALQLAKQRHAKIVAYAAPRRCLPRLAILRPNPVSVVVDTAPEANGRIPATATVIAAVHGQ